MHTDTLQLIDEWGPEKVVCVSDGRTGMRGVHLFHGGAKAGIIGDPHAPNKEAVLRAFARALANEVPAEYVFGLDMGLTEHDAAIFVDELGDRGAAVGLPRALGGLPYDELGVTGYGVAEATDAAAAISLPMTGARVALR